MTATEEMTIKIAQVRKSAFIRAKLAIKCLESNTDKNKCMGCQSYRICREVIDSVS